jgi:hypothetical protein
MSIVARCHDNAETAEESPRRDASNLRDAAVDLKVGTVDVASLIPGKECHRVSYPKRLRVTHAIICRGFESVVRYIARPTISEALFSYRRAA